MIQVWNFRAIYNTRDAVLPIFKNLALNIQICIRSNLFFGQCLKGRLRKEGPILSIKRISWGGGSCRWGTSEKLSCVVKLNIKDGLIMSVLLPMRCIALKRKNDQIGFYHFVIGALLKQIALQYCYTIGFVWHEDGVRLYELLDRVSCWVLWK